MSRLQRFCLCLGLAKNLPKHNVVDRFFKPVEAKHPVWKTGLRTCGSRELFNSIIGIACVTADVFDADGHDEPDWAVVVVRADRHAEDCSADARSNAASDR